jgi:hypothetical protein
MKTRHVKVYGYLQCTNCGIKRCRILPNRYQPCGFRININRKHPARDHLKDESWMNLAKMRIRLS